MKRSRKLRPATRATIFEVGPRDGLQSEDKIFSVEQRTDLIVLLARAGLQDIEVGSFVRADRIPQLQNTADVIRAARARLGGLKTRFWAFIPNERGLQDGLQSGIDGASFFIATSETFCHKNVNRSRDELYAELKRLLPMARKAKVKSRVYLSTLVHCPYEGPVKPAKVASLVDRLADTEATEIVLSDTTGHATPTKMRAVLDKVVAKHGASRFAVHLHDTRGLSVVNVAVCLEYGIARFDASVGGLGGCPYAPGASGNLATEDLVYFLDSLKLNKTVRLDDLGRAGRFAQSIIGRELPSRVLKTLKESA